MKTPPFSPFKILTSPFRIATIAVLIGVFLAAPANAAVLLQYNFNVGTATQTPQPPDVEASNVDGSNAAWNISGFSGPPATENLGFGGTRSSAYVRTQQSSSFSVDRYFTFTLTANPGYVLNLTSLTFDLKGTNASSVSGNDRTIFAQVRTDAEASDFSTSLNLSWAGQSSGSGTEASLLVPINTTNAANYHNSITLDLSGAQYQGLTEITFRIYAHGEVGNQIFWNADNVVLNGAVAVPEPATSALFIASGLVSMIWIRRRHGVSRNSTAQ